MAIPEAEAEISRSMVLCPIRGLRCTPECAWNLAGECAITIIARRLKR